MSALTLARNFSRQGAQLLRVSAQSETATVTKNQEESLITKTALLFATLGVSISTYTIVRLQDRQSQLQITAPKS